MKKTVSILLIMMFLFSLIACAEDIDSISENDSNITDTSTDTSQKPTSDVISCSYAEFRPCIITFDRTQTILSHEIIENKEQIDAFIVRYQEKIDEDYAKFEGVEAVQAQTKALEEQAYQVFEKFDEAFFEQNVLYLIALPVSASRFDIEEVKVQTATMEGQLNIDIVITNVEGTADESNLLVSTVAVWIDREVAQEYGENIVVTKITV